jgi:NAD(P)H-hydrate epimerase
MIHRYNGIMTDKLYTAEQVRGIDYAAIHDSGIAGYTLMCRAGRAVVDDARSRYPSARHWLVLCGAGNNGGDGYVVARLALEAGIGITVCSLVDPAQLKGDAARAHSDWQAAGGKLENWPLPAIVYLNQLNCPVSAIDIPSGLNADTGALMAYAVRAQNTVTFVGRKRGMYTADGPDYCGDIVFNDLDIPPQARHQYAAVGGSLLSPACLAEISKPRLRNSHKGSFGHVLAVGGIEGMGGAIRLCGEAALRSGAGRVTLLTDPAHAALINLARPELMVKAIRGGGEGPDQLSGDHVVAVGPGLGNAAWSRSVLETCLEAEADLVVDADGLNLLAEQSQQNTVKRGKWILTPHPGEAARLLNCKVADIQRDRVRSATAIAKRFNACVVLKGCGTIVADSSGEFAICPWGNPGMATAGSGDVLTGVIAALLGQGLSCFDAAKAGVYAHAVAGDLAAEKSGEVALIAHDIIGCLPDVWKSV